MTSGIHSVAAAGLTASWLLWLLLPVAASVAPSFQQVILDTRYIAYERDVGDVDGDGDNDLVAIQEGDTTLQVFRAPGWTRSTLVTFTGAYRYPRADDLKLADMDGDGDLDIVTRLGDGPSSDAAVVIARVAAVPDESKTADQTWNTFFSKLGPAVAAKP